VSDEEYTLQLQAIEDELERVLPEKGSPMPERGPTGSRKWRRG